MAGRRISKKRPVKIGEHFNPRVHVNRRVRGPDTFRELEKGIPVPGFFNKSRRAFGLTNARMTKTERTVRRPSLILSKGYEPIGKLLSPKME